MSHGSRDRRAGSQFQQFAIACRQALHPQPVVGGQLELAATSLAQQLVESFAGSQASISQATVAEAIVVPVMMASGVHVREDIPAEIAKARRYFPQVKVRVTPALGQAVQLLEILRSHCAAAPTCDALVLWGHGSRRSTFARDFDSTCASLSAEIDRPVVAAYGKQQPDLTQQVGQLYRQGHRKIGILTCLLFQGWLSDRLLDSARELETQWPQLQLWVSPVLMPHPLWVSAVRELVSGATEQWNEVEGRSPFSKLDAA